MRSACLARWIGVLALVITLFGTSSCRKSELRQEQSLVPSSFHKTKQPPNVLFIVIDTLRSDHLGAYGSRRGLTPNLDALAAQGLVFENAIASSSWTRSSVASVFTSRYPSAIGVLGRDDAISSEVATLAEVLKERAGYQTLGVSTNKNAGAPYGFAQGFDRFIVPDLKAGYPGDFEIHIAEGVTRKALEILDETDNPTPLFLFLHYVDPHDPYLRHPGLLSEAEPAGRFDGSRQQLQLLDSLHPFQVTKADRDRIKHLYAGEVKYCDLWLAELFEGLKQRGLEEELLIMVTSDHGEGLWDHGFRAHGFDLYEEMIRVPLIVRLPATAGRPTQGRIEQPVSLVDLAPTILSWAGAPVPETFQGVDLTPLIQGQKRARRFQYIFSEMDLDGRNFDSVRLDQTKIIRDRRKAGNSSDLEIYNLVEDPYEKQPLSKGAVAGAEHLQETLEEWSTAMKRESLRAAHVDLSGLDQESLKALQALGYVGGDGKAGLPGRGMGASRAGIASTIDFSTSSDYADQLLGGFYEQEEDRRWVSARASVLLHRKNTHTSWRIVGWIDLQLHEQESLEIKIKLDGNDQGSRKIASSGFFLLEGEIPPGDAGDVILDLECDHHFVPAARIGTADERPLCVVIRSIGLY